MRIGRVNSRAKAVLFAVLLLAVPAGIVQGQTIVTIGGPPSAAGGDVWFMDPPNIPGTEYRIQLLYTAAEIGMAGTINGLWWLPWDNAGGDPPVTQTFTTMTTTLGHTNLAQLAVGAVMNGNITGTQAVVYNAAYTIPNTVANGVWETLPMAGTFAYNGVDNLIVDIYVTAAIAGTNYWGGEDIANGRNVSDWNPFDGTGDWQYGAAGIRRFAIRIQFAGGGGGGAPAGGGEVTGGGSGGGGCLVKSLHGERLDASRSVGVFLLLSMCALFMARRVRV
ncbi:MAG: hypothetical protein RDV41_02455 [Planctomycetota bacterium]|nr:hypothetical protein [Planctomycetota bacterium]